MKITFAAAVLLGLVSVEAHRGHHHKHHHHEEGEKDSRKMEIMDEDMPFLARMIHPLRKMWEHHEQAFKWGKLHMFAEDFTQEESRCPFKRYFNIKTDKYAQIEDLRRNENVQTIYTDKHIKHKMQHWKHHPEQQCPVMKFFENNDWAHMWGEHHLTPFEGETPDDIDAAIPEADGIPTAIFHGLGDACINPGMAHFSQSIQKGTGGKVFCVEVGVPSLGETFNNFETIAEKSCNHLAKKGEFHGEFNVVGLSQGGLLARYIAEECEMKGKVRNLLSIGGPNMGVDAVPNCSEGIFCKAVNYVARKLVYKDKVQNSIAPAGYFRDVKDLKTYKKDSVFLPALNNEGTHAEFSAVRKQKFSDLNGAMFVMFEDDTVVYPKESAWFQTLDSDGKLLALNQTDFWNNDYIGLKSLHEAGKAHFVSVPGNHLQFTTQDIEETFIPFLNQ